MSDLEELVNNLPELMGRLRHLESLDAGNAVALQGEPVDSTSPSMGDILSYDGTEWSVGASGSNIKIGQVWSDAQLTLTNSFQDVPNCTKTLTFETGEILVVWAHFDFEMQYTSSTNDLVGTINFDGSDKAAKRAVFEGNNPGDHAVVSQIYIITPTAGSKTFKLRARRTTTGSGDWCQKYGTSMFWMRAKIFTDESA